MPTEPPHEKKHNTGNRLKKRKLHDKTQGARTLRAALNSKPAKPLTALQRDTEGPQGQPIGSTTCDPKEVDAIARRAWKTIYDGNHTKTNQLIHNFFRKYNPHIYTQKQFQVNPITGTQLKETCAAAKKSAAGLDNFSPEDFTQLSNLTYEWLAFALNLIEDGEAWPDDILQAKATHLAKDAERTDDPIAYRVLMILPVLYRRWASTRLND